MKLAVFFMPFGHPLTRDTSGRWWYFGEITKEVELEGGDGIMRSELG